ncbi:SGNH/GDSL hydrolase family protein [Bacillus sp. ISL-7]|uniref:SGNH/GDSL hydrolase family protein n=1 Tax=Bacillus sp. ISL-7 TaxID=2819136 RepID=UPI001BE544EF|nr:SGNH/GDSL hydrolase family protein [Bacillus sp. ISL-7]MBT2738374.1 SGNH/GDSL hydrolase family protein [Bacillus sp. ISL-7]
MKNFLTILLGIACVALLYYGHSYWNQRIATASNTAPSTSDQQTSEMAIQSDDSDIDLLTLTKNWPASSVERFKHTLNEKKAFKVLFIGSPAIGSENTGPFPFVKEKLLETFGKDNIQVTIKTYNSTSIQFIKSNDQEEISKEEADLIVFEPFILMNNGEVLIENSLEDITMIMEDIKAKNPETNFILQPSYPLYKAKIYPTQVEALKKFAEKSQLTYMDHWSAWPDPNTKEINEYLLPDQSAPSEKGNQVWGEYITNFLISKSESE